jgi:threonine dehydrogenase-like Zn-dependent dehydrogenase
MRSGARLGCVVNGRAGREAMFAEGKPPQGERIAVIGAGPAGLTYASLVADMNTVTVFERDDEPGGAFRVVGKAPFFQGVEANEQSFARYIDQLYRACVGKNVRFVFDIDIATAPEELGGFDRIVIATGARYRFGLTRWVEFMLESGAARSPLFRKLFAIPKFRDWFYYQAREGTAAMFKPLVKGGQKIVVIGDAVEAGKSKAAIASAFEAALLEN